MYIYHWLRLIWELFSQILNWFQLVRNDSKYFPFSVFISGPFLLRDVGIVSSEEMQSIEGFVFIFLVMAWSDRPSCIIGQELVLEDGIHGKVKKSLLFKLSQNGALKNFKKIILVSSPKDQYVPSYSARVQVTSLNPY